MLSFTATLAAALSIFTATQAADTNAWKSRNIYFALTDRIARSATDTGGSACSNLGNYCGGTFAGLQGKLDYIQGMGFDAIWITPVVANSPGGYHGYWAQDLFSINPNYGTAQDLKNLVNAAHGKGMYVMVDVVANHMSTADISTNRPAPLNDPSNYHTPCTIDYDNQTSVEVCRIASNLPDVFTTKPYIRTLYQDWISGLMQNYTFDGMRIDTVKHVEKDFWDPFVQAGGAYAIGEVWEGDVGYVADYQNHVPGLLNYPIYGAMIEFYQQKNSVTNFVNQHNAIGQQFKDPTALGNFVDNHDNPRFLSTVSDTALLKNALAYVHLARGIPITYYGTEQGFNGNADPVNREDLWRSGFNTNTDIYKSIAKLAAARKAAGGLAGNDHVNLYAQNSNYVWSRAGGKLIVVTTNAGSGTNNQICFNSQVNNGAWNDVFGTGSYTSDGSGNLCVTNSNGQPAILQASGGSGSPTTGSPASSTQPANTKTATTLKTSTTQAACASMAAVTFSEKISTNYGDTIKVVGSNAQLGNWDVSKAVPLNSNGYTIANPVWSGSVSIPAGQSFQYKFIRVTSSGTVTWEADPNRSLTMPPCATATTVQATWQGS